MKIQFNAEQVKLKKELRQYFSEMMTPELTEECERDLGEGGGHPNLKKSQNMVISIWKNLKI